MTPKAYASAHRAARVRRELARPGASVTAAIYDAGFNSSGRFYEAADEMLGMTPSDYRAGGAQRGNPLCDRRVLAGRDPGGAQRTGGLRHPAGRRPRRAGARPAGPLPARPADRRRRGLRKLVATVVGFVEAPALGLDLPLDLRGTAFQQRVWQALRGDSGRRDHQLRRDRPADRRAASRRGRWRRPARPTPSRWRYPATGWCAPTARCRATAGGSSASARC